MGKKLHYKYNLKKSLSRDTDLLFHEFFDKTQPLPSSADLRSGYTPIKDQGELGACTAFSAVSVMEYLFSKNIDLSELYFYYQERAEDGDIVEDSGSTIRRSATVATTIGTCSESLDPYIVADFATPPGSKADEDAVNHKVKTKYKVTTINDILYSVGVLKRPILIGIDVYESFENIGSDGYVPMPKDGEKLLGGHALNICGYFYKNKGILDDIVTNIEEKIKELLTKEKYNGLYFIIRNSWSQSFGDKGYLYMPAEFLQKYSSDWWHIDLE